MQPTKDKPVTVIFRRWKYYDGDVIALFPELPADVHGMQCMSFEHVGQHGSADYHEVMHNTEPATPEEYGGLRAELEDRGYVLVVRSRQMGRTARACRMTMLRRGDEEIARLLSVGE